MVRKLLAGILFLILALGSLSAAASATPNVVDQYTEQVPTPGGNKPSYQAGQAKGPDRSDNANGKGGGNPGSDSYSGAIGGTSGGGSSGTSDSGLSTSSSGPGASGAASQGSGSKSRVGQGETAPGLSDNPAPQSGSPEADSAQTASQLDQTGVATPEAGDMGWVFPALLIASVLLIGALTIARRFRSGDSVATR